MRTTACAVVALTSLCAFQPAVARDVGTINQASVYEQTMRFYLHPAHFFWSSEARQPLSHHPAVLARQQPSLTNDLAVRVPQLHPAVTSKRQQQTRLEFAVQKTGAVPR